MASTDSGKQQIVLQFKKIDTDKDGRINWWEFLSHEARSFLAKRPTVSKGTSIGERFHIRNFINLSLGNAFNNCERYLICRFFYYYCYYKTKSILLYSIIELRACLICSSIVTSGVCVSVQCRDPNRSLVVLYCSLICLLKYSELYSFKVY